MTFILLRVIRISLAVTKQNLKEAGFAKVANDDFRRRSKEQLGESE